MKHYLLFVFAICVVTNNGLLAQSDKPKDKFRFVFYNVENYFDALVDSTLSYNDFSPNGEMHWTSKKFYEKGRKLYQVFQALSGWEGFTVAGVCEIENEAVLNNLLYNTPLKKMNYKYVHYNSNDKRGIDVALIYGEQFTPIYSEAFSIFNEQEEQIETRDILYVKGLLENDTVHVFVNHWTSRYRGLMESNALRMQFSEILKSKTDSILGMFPKAHIIAMGDFNDQQEDASIQNLIKDGSLIGLSASPFQNNVSGTLKYKEEWYIFDQIFVSRSLFDGNSLRVSSEGLIIFDMPFVLEEDNKYLGYKPFRTNIGYKYNGGYSDHLPVFFDLTRK